MEIEVRSICGKYQEVYISETASGTLDNKEAVSLALDFLNAAESLLYGADLRDESTLCSSFIAMIDKQ